MGNRIHVCSLSALNETLISTGATHLISLINNEVMISTPETIKASNHLRLTMNDISLPTDGLFPPERTHIEELLAFTGKWEQETPMLIHCLAGISRSTAAAFIALCALNPTTPEHRIAKAIRDTSPTAHPNRLMVSYADAALNRDGRMIGAIEKLGLGVLAAEGQPFSMPSNIREEELR